jgi:hypothetical protein
MGVRRWRTRAVDRVEWVSVVRTAKAKIKLKKKKKKKEEEEKEEKEEEEEDDDDNDDDDDDNNNNNNNNIRTDSDPYTDFPFPPHGLVSSPCACCYSYAVRCITIS